MQYLKKEIRERILSAAVEEFKQHGFSDASIRNIANNAEISLGNIYRYFANKEALYFAIINPFMDSVKTALEQDFVFQGKSMKEISELLVAFLVKYSDELIIIRKGNSVHHESFVSYIVAVISAKIKEMVAASFPDISAKIVGSAFYEAIAEGFLVSLFKVLGNEDVNDVQERSVRELITFYFGHFADRFAHFEVE